MDYCFNEVKLDSFDKKTITLRYFRPTTTLSMVMRQLEVFGDIKQVVVAPNDQKDTLIKAAITFEQLHQAKQAFKSWSDYYIRRLHQSSIKSRLGSLPHLKRFNHLLYCDLPFEDSNDQTINNFLQYFMQFGDIEYCRIIKNKTGQPAFAYLKYFQILSLKNAFNQSDSRYSARLEKQPLIFINNDQMREQVHAKCGKYVKANTLKYHRVTCARIFLIKKHADKVKADEKFENEEKAEENDPDIQTLEDEIEKIQRLIRFNSDGMAPHAETLCAN